MATALALVVGVAGFAVAGTGDSDATVSAPRPAAVPASVTTTTVPETTTTTVPETTTTTAPPTTTTTVAPEPVTTTTAPPPPPATTTTTAPPRTVTAVPAPNRQAQVEAIADGSGWDWRSVGVRFVVGYHPTECCHWGVYDSRHSIIYVGPSAFGTATRLRYVVLHELAHAWQYRTGRFATLIADYEPFGVKGTAAALEAGADCIAVVWRADSEHYWSCPASAQALAARRLAGDWA